MATAVATVPRRICVSDDSRYITIGQVCEHFACSRMWIERRLKDANFPKPIQFGGKTSARRWKLADVLAWEVERAKVNGGASWKPTASDVPHGVNSRKGYATGPMLSEKAARVRPERTRSP